MGCSAMPSSELRDENPCWNDLVRSTSKSRSPPRLIFSWLRFVVISALLGSENSMGLPCGVSAARPWQASNKPPVRTARLGMLQKLENLPLIFQEQYLTSAK